MALDINSIVLQPQPQNRLDLTGLNQTLFKVQEMARLREQMEEMRRRNRADEELRRRAEAGDMARANLSAQVEREKYQAALLGKQQEAQLEREKAERATAQKLQEQKVAEYGKFSAQAGKLSQEEMAAQAPLMRSLGMGVDYLGSADGMDSWRVTMDAEKARAEQAAREAQTAQGLEYDAYGQQGSEESPSASLARMRAMGHDTIGEQGTLDDPGGADRTPVPTADAYAQALAAMDQATRTGQPARGPDPEDHLGGVPGNVIDLGAIRAQTLSQLDPMMLDLIKARPEEYQDSALRSARAVRRMRLNPADSAKAFDEMQRSPEQFTLDEIKAERAAELAETRAAAKNAPKPLDEMQTIQARKIGEDRAEQEFDKKGLYEALDARNKGNEMLGLLNEKDPELRARLSQVLGPAIMTISGVKGTQSDRDMLKILGSDQQTWTTQAFDYIDRMFLTGGFTKEQVDAFTHWIEERVSNSTLQINEWMDSSNARLNGAEEHDQEKIGRRNFMMGLPQDLRDEYEVYRHDKGEEDAPAVDEVPGQQPGRPAPIGSVHPASYYQPGQKMPANARRYDAAGNIIAGEPEAETIPIDQDADYQEALANATAETGLNPDFIGRVVGGGSHGFRESGGDPTAKNPNSTASGLIQFTTIGGAKVGVTPEEIRNMTRAEQVPYMVDYFVKSGVTDKSPPEDYALAVAAPAFVGRSKDRNAVVYSKGTENHAVNRPWWPPDGGDITVGSILDYYGMGTGGGAARGAAPSKLDAEALELMRKLRE